MVPSQLPVLGLFLGAFGRLGVICRPPGPEQPTAPGCPAPASPGSSTSAWKVRVPESCGKTVDLLISWSSLKKWTLFLRWALFSAVIPAPAPGPGMGWVHHKWVLNYWRKKQGNKWSTHVLRSIYSDITVLPEALSWVTTPKFICFSEPLGCGWLCVVPGYGNNLETSILSKNYLPPAPSPSVRVQCTAGSQRYTYTEFVIRI